MIRTTHFLLLLIIVRIVYELCLGNKSKFREVALQIRIPSVLNSPLVRVTFVPLIDPVHYGHPDTHHFCNGCEALVVQIFVVHQVDEELRRPRVFSGGRKRNRATCVGRHERLVDQTPCPPRLLDVGCPVDAELRHKIRKDPKEATVRPKGRRHQGLQTFRSQRSPGGTRAYQNSSGATCLSVQIGHGKADQGTLLLRWWWWYWWCSCGRNVDVGVGAFSHVREFSATGGHQEQETKHEHHPQYRRSWQGRIVRSIFYRSW